MPPTLEARPFHNPRIADIENHPTAREVSHHRIEERFHLRFAEVVQHPLGDSSPGLSRGTSSNQRKSSSGAPIRR